MRGTMSLRKKIAILTMASMTVWGVTALLPFNQGGAVGNVGYAAEITPEKQVSMDYKTSGGTTAQTTGDLYYAFIDSTNSWWGHAGQIFVTDSGSIGTATAPLALYGQVLGGQYNTASGNYSVVLGGSGNTASGVYSVVTGGANNIASGRNSIVVSGSTNTASGENASIMGGNTNTASGTNSTIIGGSNNKNGAANGIIIGGNQHELTSGTDTVFVGGTVNKSSGNANQSVLIGGTKNTVGGRQAGIFGGTYNMTAGTLTSVYGGASNTVSGTGTAILGGWSNAASGLYSVLVGGEKGAAQGQYSVALGGASTADTAKDAVAIGIGASANVEKGVAIGAGAVATEAGTISVGHNKGDKYYQTSYTVNGGGTVKEQTYSSNLYNRLVNVGYGKDGHDAATMDQLTKVSAGDRISVASETDQTTGAATYKISVNNDGAVVSGDANLVAGGTVYSEVRPSSDGTYVKTASTTGDNLLALDKQVDTNAKNITDLTNLTNITDAGKTVIKNLAKGTIDMENGSYTTVSSREVDGVKTFKVDVASDGKVEEGNSGLVTGDTVYDALNKASQDTNKNLDKKANIDASNIGSNLKNADGTAASEEDQKKNAESWGKAIGTGEVKESDNRLVTGDTVAKAIKDETRVSEDGTYVKKDATAGKNLKNLDDQVKKNTDNITSIKNITDNLDNNYAKTDLSNVTDEGKTTIKNLAQDAVKVVNGKNTTVTTKTETNGNISYAVNVDDSAIKDVMKEDMDKKADRDAGNLTDSDVTSWQKKLGTGESQSGDHRLISGDTLYNALKEVDGNTLMKTDGVTINIDQTGTAKTIDVRGKDGVTRTITGIATDPSDPTSAANVDYVDHRVESLNSRMTHEVSRAGAGAAALAALHPLEWDPDSKFEFALGYGHYKAANAAALGLFYRPNEDVMYNLGGTLGNGDAMMSGGVTFRFGTKGRKPKASPLAMQQTIMDQNAKIEHQDEMLKIQANKIDSLEKELLDLKRLITQK
ncbi:MAG: YadA-like family protein [Acidaminococcus intestini]|uniref:YadA-like family protein n=1 Tax=Acidaminococcus intestini TaxID=187327 RepID=UPI00242E2EEC|nr:YadA-like family protein [Acidaminococcus intestini]